MPVSEMRRAILLRVRERDCLTALAASIGRSKSTACYHLAALEAEGYVIKDNSETRAQRLRMGGASRVQVWCLTEKGVGELAAFSQESSSTPRTGASPGGDRGVRLDGAEPVIEVHGVEMKVPVTENGVKWWPHQAPMNHWTRFWDPGFHGCYLEWTGPHYLIRTGAFGRSFEEALGGAVVKLTRAYTLLKERYHSKIGVPEIRDDWNLGRAKVGVLNLAIAQLRPDAEGKLEEQDATPQVEGDPGHRTVHPKNPAHTNEVVRIALNAAEGATNSRELREAFSAWLRLDAENKASDVELKRDLAAYFRAATAAQNGMHNGLPPSSPDERVEVA